MIVTPSSTIVSSARVNSQFPPRSAARSTITEPGAMPSHHIGRHQHRRFLPGHDGGRDDHVAFAHDAAPSIPAGARRTSSSCAVAYPRASCASCASIGNSTNRAPRLCTCSFTAGRTSYAETTAPKRRAVAIACNPATPTPMIRTVARSNRARRRREHREKLSAACLPQSARPCIRRQSPSTKARPCSARAWCVASARPKKTSRPSPAISCKISRDPSGRRKSDQHLIAPHQRNIGFARLVIRAVAQHLRDDVRGAEHRLAIGSNLRALCPRNPRPDSRPRRPRPVSTMTSNPDLRQIWNHRRDQRYAPLARKTLFGYTYNHESLALLVPFFDKLCAARPKGIAEVARGTAAPNFEINPRPRSPILFIVDCKSSGRLSHRACGGYHQFMKNRVEERFLGNLPASRSNSVTAIAARHPARQLPCRWHRHSPRVRLDDSVWRPSAVSFVATGLVMPNPKAVTALAGTCWSTRYSRTDSARCSESR